MTHLKNKPIVRDILPGQVQPKPEINKIPGHSNSFPDKPVQQIKPNEINSSDKFQNIPVKTKDDTVLVKIDPISKRLYVPTYPDYQDYFKSILGYVSRLVSTYPVSKLDGVISEDQVYPTLYEVKDGVYIIETEFYGLEVVIVDNTHGYYRRISIFNDRFFDAKTNTWVDLNHSYVSKSSLFDISGKIKIEYIPALAITETFFADSLEEMYEITNAQRGDICIINSIGTFIRCDDSTIQENNWIKLATPTDVVTSVNGKTGAIVLTSEDIKDLSTNYQKTLVSGSNIKTINNQSLLGSGNITIESGLVISRDIKVNNRVMNRTLVFDTSVQPSVSIVIQLFDVETHEQCGEIFSSGSGSSYSIILSIMGLGEILLYTSTDGWLLDHYYISEEIRDMYIGSIYYGGGDVCPIIKMLDEKIDVSPTENSHNLITSGAVHSAIITDHSKLQNLSASKSGHKGFLTTSEYLDSNQVLDPLSEFDIFEILNADYSENI